MYTLLAFPKGHLRAVAIVLGFSFQPACADVGFVPLWTVQLGTGDYEESYGVSADNLGNAYVAGGAQAAPLNPSSGVLSKYASDGALLWTQRLGSSPYDVAYDVSADSLGNVYVSGGWRHTGSVNAFVNKYDALGNLLWTTPLTPSPTNTDSLQRADISADNLGNFYVSGATIIGNTIDAFISKYDATGDLQWTRQYATEGIDVSYGVSADGLGNVYIAGATTGSLAVPNLGTWDAFVSKYDADGNLLWTRQRATDGIDIVRGVSSDGLGSIYIAGETIDDSGDYASFVSKYDSMGVLAWTSYLNATALSYGVSADSLGNVFIAGDMIASLDGIVSRNAFVSKYNSLGHFIGTRLVGSDDYDSSPGISADGLGNVYISGFTYGSLGGMHAGHSDSFVAKFGVPEPKTIFLALISGIALLPLRRSLKIDALALKLTGLACAD